MREKAVVVFMPYCPGSLGEQIVQIPFFHFVRERHPETEIIGVAPEGSGDVVKALGFVDRLHRYPVRRGLPELARLTRELRTMRCEIAYQLRRKSLRASLMARLSNSTPIVGFRHGVNKILHDRFVEYDTGRYIAENYAAIVGRTTQEFADSFSRQSGGYVLVIPAGRTAIKRYPMKQYLEVARALAPDVPVRFLLGPQMEAERREVESALPSAAIDYCPPISDVDRLVQRAALVIANDCGPAHFAHVRDIPRVSVFDCSIDAQHWFFAGRRGRLLRSPARGRIDQIPVETVLSQARELLDRY